MVIFYKKLKKYNENQLTKKKIDLKNVKMKNLPPSHDLKDEQEDTSYCTDDNVYSTTGRTDVESRSQIKILNQWAKNWYLIKDTTVANWKAQSISFRMMSVLQR